MKKNQIKIGRVYAVKVGERIVPVRILRESTFHTGWVGLNLATNREVNIRSAQRCRYEVEEPK